MHAKVRINNAGYVSLVDSMGSDLKVVQAARLSFNKTSDELDEKDKKLIKYLGDNKHTSPFRGCMVTLEIQMPMYIKNQWIKHIIGGEYQFKDTQINEVSRRYTSEDLAFEWGPEWREQSPDNKQASNEAEFTEQEVNAMDAIYFDLQQHAMTAYRQLSSLGVAREQARKCLTMATYTKVVWTASLQAVAHFIKLRNHSHAQAEITEYAQAVETLVSPLYPNAMEALLGD
ncbi:FAD-dependent thymidylate synthase [bacterium]|nr:FAD-dependent thymidylate synthase [bacterium]